MSYGDHVGRGWRRRRLGSVGDDGVDSCRVQGSVRVCSMSVICWETSARREMMGRSKVWGIGGCLCRKFRESEQEKMNDLGRQKRKTPVWAVVCLKPWEGAWRDSVSMRRLCLPQSRRVSRPWSTQHGTWGIGWFCISVRILACSLHFSFMPLLSPVVIAF